MSNGFQMFLHLVFVVVFLLLVQNIISIKKTNQLLQSKQDILVFGIHANGH